MRRIDAAADALLDREGGRGESTLPDPRIEPGRIGNPFLRFRTRAYWLSAIIRRSRAAEAERSKPDWFNR